MKNLIKVSIVLLISVMVVLFATTVNAAENDSGFTDLTSTLNNTSNNTSGNTNTNTNNSTNTNLNNTNTNTNTNNTNASNTNKNNTNTNNTNSNKNTDLPKTGIEDSIPVALLVVVFGISAIYAYKKISEYKNI